MSEYRTQLFKRIEFSPVVASTKDQARGIAPRLGTYTANVDPMRIRDGVILAGFVVAPPNRSGRPAEWVAGEAVEYRHADFLLDPPIFITKANKNFVMVASASSQEAAIREMNRLKHKAPQFDFVVYAPYRGNPNYAIMMASWVSYSVAKQALELAKKHVNPGSIIWSCRSEGTSC